MKNLEEYGVKELYPFKVAYDYFIGRFGYEIVLEGKDKISIYDAELKLTSVKIDNPDNKREEELEIDITLILLCIMDVIRDIGYSDGKSVAKQQIRDVLGIENCKCND